MTRTPKMPVLFLILSAACVPPGDTELSNRGSPLDGAWQLVAAETITPDGRRLPGQFQESFLLFAGDYYSMNWARGEIAAPHSAEPLRPTDAEKVDRYNSVIVNAGRLEVSEGVLTIRPDFALVPEYVGGLGEFDYTLTDDTLEFEWRTIESADGAPDPDTAAGVRFRYRWTRR